MNNSNNFFQLVAEFQKHIDWLNQVLKGGEKDTINIDGDLKPSISKDIADKWAALQGLAQGRKAYSTKGLMDSDLSPSDGTLAEVWNDPTLTNNGLYGKVGGAGAGSWAKSPLDLSGSIAINTHGVEILTERTYLITLTDNIYFEQTKVSGEYMENSGVIVTNPLYCRSQKIGIEEGVTYQFAAANENINGAKPVRKQIRKTCYFNALDEVVEGGDTSPTYEFTVPTGKGITHVVISPWDEYVEGMLLDKSIGLPLHFIIPAAKLGYKNHPEMTAVDLISNGKLINEGVEEDSVVSRHGVKNVLDEVNASCIDTAINKSETSDNLIPINVRHKNTIPMNGNLVHDASYDTSSYMPVTAGVLYYVYAFKGVNIVPGRAGRNINWMKADGTSIENVSNSNFSNGPFEAPAEAELVRISWRVTVDDFDTIYFGKTPNPTDIAPKGALKTLSGEDVAFDTLIRAEIQHELTTPKAVVSKQTLETSIEEAKLNGIGEGEIVPAPIANLFNFETMTTGHHVNPTGSLSFSENYDTSDYIKVTAGETLTGNYYGSTRYIFRKSCYYDENKNVVEGGWAGDQGDAYMNRFTVPANAVFIRVSVPSAINSATIGRESKGYCLRVGESTEWVYFDPSIGNPNLLNPETLTRDHYLTAVGTLSPNDQYHVSDYITVAPGTVYSGNQSGKKGNVFRFVTYFDENKGIILGGSDGWTDRFTTPASCAFVRVTIPSENHSQSFNPDTYCLIAGTSREFRKFTVNKYMRLKNGYGTRLLDDHDIVTKRHLDEYDFSSSGGKVTISNSEKIMFTGCSYDEGSYVLRNKNWINKASEFTDYICGNTGVSGQRIIDIARRLREDEVTRMIKPSTFNPTYITIANNGNEYFPGSGYDLDLYKGQISVAKTAIDSFGAKMILGTNYHVNKNTFLESDLKYVANELGIDYMGIGTLGEHLMAYSYKDFWGGSHPGTRNNAYEAQSWRYYLNQMPRPRRSIKIYRPRTGVTIDAENLAYDTLFQRLEKFQEINVGESSLNETNNSDAMYDRLDSGSYSYQTNNCEYALLLQKSEVQFNDAVLIEFVTDNTGIESLTALVGGDSGIQWYLMNNRDTETAAPIVRDAGIVFKVTKSVYDSVNDPVGTKFTSSLIDNGASEFSFTGKLKSYAMGKGWFLCFTSDEMKPTKASGGGTIDRVGGGSYVVTNNMTSYRYSYQFFAELFKAKGIFEQVESVYNDGTYQISMSGASKYQQYDKVKLLGVKPGSFNLSNAELYFKGGAEKVLTIKEITQKQTGTELIKDRGFDASGTNWTLNGNLIESMPSDVRSYPISANVGSGNYHVVLTKDTDNFANELTRTLNITEIKSDLRGFKKVVIRVLARVFPAIYNPDMSGKYFTDTPQVTSDSCDYATLLVSLSGSGAKSTLRDVVDIGWHEVTFETTLPPFITDIKLELMRDPEVMDTSHELQIYDVSFQVI